MRNFFWTSLFILLMIYAIRYSDNRFAYILPWFAFSQIKGDWTFGLGTMTVGAMMQRIILASVGLILVIGLIGVIVGHFI